MLIFCLENSQKGLKYGCPINSSYLLLFTPFGYTTEMKVTKNLWLWLLLIILLIAIARFGISGWKKYKIWKSHQTYFEQAPENRKIEAWMTPNFIKRHYKIKVTSVLGQRPGFWEERKPLTELCLDHQLDCQSLLEKLNSKIGK